MGIEDNDNIYMIEEEEDFETSPRNYASYNTEEEGEQKEDIKSGSSIVLLFQIMFNPVEGWKKLRRSGVTVESLQGGCFYPFLSLLALSQFAEYFYKVDISLSQVVTQAVVSFVAFFFGYFSVLMVISWLFPKTIMKDIDEKFLKSYIVVAMSSLALFSVFINILPMLWPILIFLPIWTMYFMFKGVRFFKLPQNRETKFLLVSGVAVIAMPLLIDWVLNSIMPY